MTDLRSQQWQAVRRTIAPGAWLAVATAALALGCQWPGSPDEGGTRARSATTAAFSDDIPFTNQQLTWPPDAAVLPSDAYEATGLVLPPGWSALLAFSGTLTYSPGPDCGSWPVYGPGGSLAPSSGVGGDAWLRVAFGDRATYGNDPQLWSAPNPSAPETVWRRIDEMNPGASSGPLEMYRKRFPDCYVLSGGHMAQIRAVRLKLLAAPTTIASGQAVRASIVPLNFTVTPGQEIYWAVRGARPPYPRVDYPQCRRLMTCDLTLPSLSAYAAVDYEVPSGDRSVFLTGTSDTLHLFNCPTGDPWLDSPSVRDVLLQALFEGNANAVDRSTRRERGGYIVQRPDGTYEAILEPVTALDTPCSRATAPPPTSAVATFHIHPFLPRVNGTGGELLPTNCGRLANFHYGAGPHGIFSARDWKNALEFGKRAIVIDRSRVYAMTALTADSTNWAQNVRTNGWNTSSCRWLS
jgi:hypothetical protein